MYSRYGLCYLIANNSKIDKNRFFISNHGGLSKVISYNISQIYDCLFNEEFKFVLIEFKIIYVYDHLHSFCQYSFSNLPCILLVKVCVEDISSFYHKQLNGKFILKKLLSR